MKKAWFFLCGWLLWAVPAGLQAQQLSYQTLDDPNASASSGGTMAQGVSGGNVVGTYFDGSGVAHGFLYDGDSYVSLDEPDAVGGTYAIGISGGEIVGYYVDAGAQTHGFLYDGSTYTSLDDPNAVFNNGGTDIYFGTYATGVSDGNIVGYYFDINGQTHGFLDDGSSFTTLDDPIAFVASGGTYANGVDGSNIVGFYQVSANSGFLYDGNSYTTLDYPDAGGFTDAYGISGGNIVGYYQDASGQTHGFLDNGGVYTSFDYPGSSDTYATGISSNTIAGYYIDSNNHTHGFVATVSAGNNLTGSLQVTIMPSGAITAGAQWQVDGGTFQNSGATANNLSAGSHTLSFSTISGWSTPANQKVTVITNSTVTAAGIYVPQPVGSLQVTLDPPGAVSAGAQWQVDGGTFQNSGATVSNLSVRSHTVSFEPVPGWTPPPDQIVTIANGVTTTPVGLYTASLAPADGLILVTNGLGTIQHGTWPSSLGIGTEYTVHAVPKSGYVFEDWLGGANLPYSVLSKSASYTFTMQSGLLLEANFVTNPFLTASGAYYGLFAPANTDRGQTNSGSFNFILTTGGALSGNLRLSSQTVRLIGKFSGDGSAQITSKRHNASFLVTTLQLDFANQAVAGTVSNLDGSFVAQLTGYQNVFSSHNKATNYAGRYTLTIPGTTNPAIGPYGSSYGTVLVEPSGTVSFAGSLADGTPVSQSSVVSQGGYWPLYLSLYGGMGSLWSWNYFTNSTNGTVISSPSYASWINATNSSKTASYRSGFTNQKATVTGGFYNPADQPLLVLTSGEMIFAGGGLPYTISNQAMTAASDKIIFTSATNSLTLTINPTTGVVKGNFRNPSNPAKTTKLNGVLQPGQGNATGYFPGINQSGTFTLIPQ